MGETTTGPGLAGGGGIGVPLPAGRVLVGERAGDSIGPYRLLELIGEGGFGVVWLAERREPFVQRVAIKIIKPGMDSRAVIARFEQERQALAVMDHPNVAKVIDGGITSPEMGSRPYFVMEHVKGEAITEFCDRHRMTIRQRLELFIPVCEAVQHAHMKGIIHRDIKPSNILVEIKDGKGIPKVIDFGVAKAISHTLTEKTIFTETGQLIGTPEYMSPEQAEMGALDVDTRTDVYSLGVVLYELLTGLLPFDGEALRSKGFDEIRRIIREVDPPTPSRRWSGVEGDDMAVIARTRQAERVQIRRLLRRELEWIPVRAMRKDRRDRYPTAGALADDVRGYLDGQALAAGPESTSYRLRKIVRRHRIAVGLGTAVLLGLSVGLVGVLLQRQEAIRMRDSAQAAALQADKERQRAEAVATAARAILAEVSRHDTLDRRASPIEQICARILDRQILSEHPTLRADLLVQVATIARVTGHTDQAERLSQEAVELSESARSMDPLSHAAALDCRALSLTAAGDPRAALEHAVAALSIRSAGLGADHGATVESTNNLGLVLLASGEPDAGRKKLEQALSVELAARGGQHPRAAILRRNLAAFLWQENQIEEAEALFREADAAEAANGASWSRLPPIESQRIGALVYDGLGFPDHLGTTADLLHDFPIELRPSDRVQAVPLLSTWSAYLRLVGNDAQTRVEKLIGIQDSIGAAFRASVETVAADELPAVLARAMTGAELAGTARDIRGCLQAIDQLRIGRGARRVAIELLLREITPMHLGLPPRQLERAIRGNECSAPLDDWEAWEVVRTPGRDMSDYSMARDLAENATRADRRRGDYLTTLGLALFRLGRFEESLATLQRADRINSRFYPGGTVADAVFGCLAAHKLGRDSECRAAYGRAARVHVHMPGKEPPRSLGGPMDHWYDARFGEELASVLPTPP